MRTTYRVNDFVYVVAVRIGLVGEYVLEFRDEFEDFLVCAHYKFFPFNGPKEPVCVSR